MENTSMGNMKDCVINFICFKNVGLKNESGKKWIGFSSLFSFRCYSSKGGKEQL